VTEQREERRVLVLDGLFDDLDVEASVAAELGWSVERWAGGAASLRVARVAVHVRTRVDRELLARMPALRVIGRFGTGLDSVDIEAAKQRGIRVVGVRDYCVPELTMHTLALAFALDRRLLALSEVDLEPQETWQEAVAGAPMRGSRDATVVGLGTIGRAVTGALLACGLRVRVVTSHGADEARALGATPVDLPEGLAQADLLLLHTALTPATRGLIDRTRLGQMRQGAILIDTARLGLIDEAAVADALERGHLGGLGLDARLAPGSPLRRWLGDPRVLVTPHVGWYSERSARELRERTIRDTITAALAEERGA
jgi:D-3-phosphoglycerate dehydrogenase / 2-oxoglutarate reductase